MLIDLLHEEFRKLPEVLAGQDIWQNKFHEFDVFTHTIACVDAVSLLTDKIDVIAAAYLHDIGKPIVKIPKYKEGILLRHSNGCSYHSFDNHDVVGAKMVKEMNSSFFSRFELNQDYIASLVEFHFFPMRFLKQMRRTHNFDEFQKVYFELDSLLLNMPLDRVDLLNLFLADSVAKGRTCNDFDELKLFHESLNSQDLNLDQLYYLQNEKYNDKK